MSGTEKEGCQSIVISGGYEDDVDDVGYVGRDLSGNKSQDQALSATTRASDVIAKNCLTEFDAENGEDAEGDWKVRRSQQGGYQTSFSVWRFLLWRRSRLRQL